MSRRRIGPPTGAVARDSGRYAVRVAAGGRTMRDAEWRWPARMAPATTEDRAEVAEIERDILLLYHRLSEHTLIMGDLDYASVFALPYWEYLNPTGLQEEQRGTFIQEGCLVMILAMAWDQIDGSGGYLETRREPVLAALRAVRPFAERTGKLLRAVRLAVDLAVRGRPATQELIELSRWVHDQVVGGYFRERARRFRTDRG